MKLARNKEQKDKCIFALQVLHIDGFLIFGRENNLSGSLFDGYYFSNLLYVDNKDDMNYLCIKYPQYFRKFDETYKR